MSTDEAAQGAADFVRLTQEASAQFFTMMQDRHEMGEKKYGPIKFVAVNTLEEAMEELADLGNYTMYTFMKVFILNQQLQGLLPDDQEPDQLGNAGFIKDSK